MIFDINTVFQTINDSNYAVRPDELTFLYSAKSHSETEHNQLGRNKI